MMGYSVYNDEHTMLKQLMLPNAYAVLLLYGRLL